MVLFQRSQFPLLKLAFLGVVLVLGKVTFDPNLGKAIPYRFPEQVPLGQFEELNSRSVSGKFRNHSDDSPALQGQKYEYRKNDKNLTAEIYYMKEADGDIATYYKAYELDNKRITLSELNQRQNQNGSYSLFENQQTAYLTACINSQGPSTVTREQFRANRNTYDLRLDRIVPVLLAQERPRDARCLWVTLSTPLQNQSVQTAYAELEAVWNDWYQWWLPRFPQA